MMTEGMRKDEDQEIRFRLLSLANLSRKINEGISLEELYRDAERKFDTMIGLLNDDAHHKALKSLGTTIHDLQRSSQAILQLLITNKQGNPYMTLCVSEEASQDEIKRRRNKLLQVFHPDRNRNSSLNESITRNINEAYDKIMNTHHDTGISNAQVRSHLRPAASYNGKQFDVKKKRYMLYIFIVLAAAAAISVFFAFIFYA